MAIPDTLAARLIEVVNAHNISGDFAMLGRQRWRGKRKLAAADLLDATLEKSSSSLQKYRFNAETGGRAYWAFAMQQLDQSRILSDLSRDGLWILGKRNGVRVTTSHASTASSSLRT